MGLNFIGRCAGSPQNPSAVAPNPNPSRWSLIRQERIGQYLIAEVKYLDCTNYDGHKLMVFWGIDELPKTLDPHFEPKRTSPIARFRPDIAGWKAARFLATIPLEPAP